MATDVMSEFSAETVVEGLKKVLAMSQNDVDATLDQLKVSPADREQAKAKLNGLLAGDEALFSELEKDLSSTEADGGVLLAAVKGGITKFKVLTKWKIPYGFRLYVSHKIISEATSIGALIAAITAACGPEAAPLAVGLAIGLAAVKLLDRGNGIMITQVPPLYGPCIPTPQ
jgi:hypothetical protein